MKQRILTAALAVAKEKPIWLITRKAIARKADCAPSLVSYYLGSRDEMLKLITDSLPK